MNRPAALCMGLLLGLSSVSQAVAWGVVNGPNGGAAYRGPMGGGAVSGPNGGGAVRGPYGAGAVRGPNGGGAVRGPYGAGAVRGPYGGAAVRGPYGGAAVRAPYGGGYVVGVRPWTPLPYCGAVVAGVTIGAVVAATAAPRPPAPQLCWFWSSPAQNQGYWDYCPQ